MVQPVDPSLRRLQDDSRAAQHEWAGQEDREAVKRRGGSKPGLVNTPGFGWVSLPHPVCTPDVYAIVFRVGASSDEAGL